MNSSKIADDAGSDIPLTIRETEVMRLISRGASNKEIEHALQLSTSTVRTHIGNIFRKFGCSSRIVATRRWSAIENDT
ncbi:LuxR C-terminal-related transcriptional regulator [Bradyrhizobium sp. USDA 3256]